jgi:hypothetical protein
MNPQQIADRATSARIAFDEWLDNEIRRDPVADPYTLMGRGVAYFHNDPAFISGWIAASFQERIADRISNRVGLFDEKIAGSSGGSDSAAARHHASPKKPPKAPKDWKSWLATEKVPVRTKLMRRTDLVAIVTTERKEAAVHATNARLAETLLSRMPENQPALTVGDVWTDEELQRAVRASLAPAPIASIDAAHERLESLP